MVEWANDHSTLTEAQLNYARRHCFNDVILSSRHSCLCTHCKGTWSTRDEVSGTITCPSCGKKLNVIEHKIKIDFSAYYSVFTTVNNMQVCSWYLVMRDVSKDIDYCSAIHVGTEFLTERGKRYSVELPRFTMCWEKDKWCYDKPKELRKRSVFQRYIVSNADYYVKVLPILKRNGFKCRMLEGRTFDAMQELLVNNEYESWAKCGHYAVMRDWLIRVSYDYHGKRMHSGMSDTERNLIKMANRKHIRFDKKEKWADYKDFYKDLEYMGKDVHNPSVLFPSDFQKAHAELSAKADARRLRERERENARIEHERMERQVKFDERKQRWIANYSARFSDMFLTNGDFSIRPLISMADFDAEAERMHHCIRTYYGKVNTLLVTIEYCGMKCETAEISLSNKGDIIQCRGVCNKPSAYHNDIVAMLESYMNEFLKRATMELKPQNNLPVLAKHYQPFKIA